MKRKKIYISQRAYDVLTGLKLIHKAEDFSETIILEQIHLEQLRCQILNDYIRLLCPRTFKE